MGAVALNAKICVDSWAGRRELDCEVVKETKTRYVCRLVSDGLLPRVRCLGSLISANTPRQCPSLCVRLLFCREFTLSDAPETRMKRGGDFSSIYKRSHFVESGASECYLVRILASAACARSRLS